MSRPPLVPTTIIKKAADHETKSFPGVAKESQIAKLSFRVPGKLLDSNMKIGVEIPKDGIIAQLDPRDFELTVKRLEAELRAAQSTLSAMKTGARHEDLASLQSQLEAAQSAFETAEKNLKRITALLADQVAAQSQFDLAKTQFDTAKGQKETLVNELEKAQAGARQEEIDAMEAKINALEASLHTAENALKDTILEAPFNGMIVEKYIEDYEVIAPGMPIVSFVNVSQIDIAVSLPEEIVVRLSDIQNYRVKFEAYPDKEFSAQLKELGLATQKGRQNYPLQVRIDLPENENLLILPGMAANVLIDMKRAGGIPQTVPLAALVGQDENRTAVWKLKPVTDATLLGTCDEAWQTVRQPVKLLRIVDGRAEIESEMPSGERIVAAGARFLQEGQVVLLEKP